uniref:AI-2E family transporter n=1 Tax=Flavobacterium sp. TaxID=239 RepID=UPI00404A4AFF
MKSLANQITRGIIKAVLILAGILLLLLFISKIQSVIVYCVLSFVLALIGLPLLRFLKTKCKFSNLWATITTLMLFVLLIVGFILMFIPLISSQSESLSLLDIVAIENNLNDLLVDIQKYLGTHGFDYSEILSEADLTSKLNLEFIPEFLNGLLNTISSFSMGLASVLFITFFFLKDSRVMTNSIVAVLPENYKGRLIESWEIIEKLLSRYFIGLMLQLFIIFVLYLIVLTIFGVENSLIIAFLCAVLNIIPYVGPLLGMALASILTMISGLGTDFQTEILPTTIYIMVGFMIVQVIDNNVTQPLIFSNSVKSHPLEIFLVILITGFVFGIVGMIVAVPVYTILKVIAKTFWPSSKIIQLLTNKF